MTATTNTDQGRHNGAAHSPTKASLRSLQIGEGWFGERGGGLNRYYAELIRHLPNAGVDCRALVVGTEEVSTSSQGVVCAVARNDEPMLRRWRAMRRAVAREIAAGSPDLVVTHFAPYAFPILRMTRSLPLVVHFHGPWAAESRAEGAGRAAVWLKRQLESAVYRRARRCIVLSHAFRQLLAQDYGVPLERIAVVGGGVDLDRFDTRLSRAEARQRLGWPLDRPIILCVRRLVRRMGLENLIAAIAQVRPAFPDALCIIGGTGPLTDELQAQIAEAGAQASIRLAGFISDSDLPHAFRAADLSILPSVSLEGFGLVAAESLAAGTPVAVTRIGGLPEVVAPLCQELLLPGGGPEDIAAFVSGFLAGRKNLPSSEMCRQYAVDRFGWQNVAGKVADVYREAMR